MARFQHRSPPPWRRPAALLTVLLITLSVALPSHGDEDRDTRELEIIRDGHLGPLRIPTYQPTWADLSLLDELTTIASAGDLHTFGEKLLLSLGQRRGRLLVDGFDPQKFDDRSFHLPAPADVLRRWARTLPPGVLDGILERSLALPIDDAHPLLWLPEVAGAARLRLEEAIEAGDLKTARRLLDRPGLASTIDGRLTVWLLAMTAEKVSTRATPPDLAAASLAQGPLRSLARAPLRHLGGSSDRGLGASGKKVVNRRLPAPPVRPLLIDRLLLVPDGAGLVAHDLDSDLGILWRWRAPGDGTEVRRPPLTIAADIPVASGDRIALLVRTPRAEYRPTSNAIHDPSRWKLWGWNQLWILEGISAGAPPTGAWSPRLAEEGFTIASEPLIDGDRLWCVATRGWAVVESWVLAFDLSDRAELWRRKICSVPFSTHSLNDLRGKITSAQLARTHGSLWACPGNGLIARLDGDDGGYQSAIIYRRYGDERLPSQGGILWSRNRFSIYPEMRQRTPSPATVVADGSRLIVLPADSRTLIAIDLDSNAIAWHHPVPPEGSFLGLIDGHPLIFDASIAAGEDSVRLWRVDGETGILIAPGRVSHTLPAPLSAGNEQAPESARSPLLSGSPILAGDQLWIPTLEGILIASPLAGADGRVERSLRWPTGCQGGTPWPLSPGEVVLLRRGDSELGTLSGIDHLSAETAGEEEKKEP